MERDRRSRRSQSACPRPGVRAFRFVRQGKARPKQGPAKAPNTLIGRARANESPGAGRAFHVRYRGRSNVNRAARPRAQRCPNNHDARPHAAPPRPARRRPARPQKPKVRRAAPRPQKRRPGPKRVVDGSAPQRRPLGGVRALRSNSRAPPLFLEGCSELRPRMRHDRVRDASGDSHLRASCRISVFP